MPARARSRSRRPHSAYGTLLDVTDHRLLDRLVRGRLWIGILAFALIGIVTMRLAVLELGTGIGRALAHKTALERQVATLQATDSALAAGSRVEAQAAARGMQPAAAGSPTRLKASPNDARKAAAAVAALAAAAARAGTGATEAASGRDTTAAVTTSAGTTAAGTTAAGTTAGSATEAAGGGEAAAAGSATEAASGPGAATSPPTAAAPTTESAEAAGAG